MAEQQEYLLSFKDENGNDVTKTIVGPAGASEEELQAVAKQYLETVSPAAAGRRTVLGAPIEIPTQAEAAKQIAATEKQTAAQKKAMDERGIFQAFGEGFMAPRQEDPFGLQVDPSIKKYLPVLGAANLVREGVESLGYGLAEAGGQALYNLGLGQGYSPQRIGAELREFSQVGGMALPNAPLRSQAVTTEFVLPSVQQALQTVRQSAINVPSFERLNPAQRLLAASQRQQVPLMPADVGGPGMQGFTAGAGQSIMGRGPITQAAEATTEGLQAAAQRAADATGTVETPLEAGMRLKTAALTFATQTSERGRQLYDRVKDRAEGLVFRPINAAKTIDREIDRLRKKNDPADPLLRYLEEKRTQLSTPQGFDYEGAKMVLSDLKTDHRAKEELLRVTTAKDTLGRVARAMEEDVTGTMINNGRESAAGAFKTANAYWRQRVETLDEALEPILGPDVIPDQVIENINAMARGKKGGVQRLVRVINSLPEEERGSIRATIVSRLGQKPSVADNIAGQFSPADFLDNWKKISPEAKMALFGRDKNLTQALDDIAVLSEGTKQAQQFVNRSQTAGAQNYMNVFNAAAGLGGAGGLVSLGAGNFGVALTSVLLPLVLTKLSASALTSQRLVRYLADAPKKVKNADQFRAGLLDIAAKTPAISAELEALAAEMGGQ